MEVDCKPGSLNMAGFTDAEQMQILLCGNATAAPQILGL